MLLLKLDLDSIISGSPSSQNLPPNFQTLRRSLQSSGGSVVCGVLPLSCHQHHAMETVIALFGPHGSILHLESGVAPFVTNGTVTGDVIEYGQLQFKEQDSEFVV